MITAIVTHKVKDFDKWHANFVEFEPSREKIGSQGSRIFRKLDEPNEVTVELKWESLEKFNKFIQSSELKREMEISGVVSKPEISVLSEFGAYSR